MATFEGAEQAQIDQAVERMSQEPGPPTGVPGKRFVMLTDRKNGKAAAIGVSKGASAVKSGGR